MQSFIENIGHRRLRSNSISPQQSPSFSPNLFKYLKANGHFFEDGGILEDLFVAVEGTEAAEFFGVGTLLIGYIDEACFIGSRIGAALSQGNKAPKHAYLCTEGLQRVDGFWDNYLKIGRCAIDPEHKIHFMGDRFSMNQDTRTCLWCGATHERVLTPRTVFDETWVSRGVAGEE